MIILPGTELFDLTLACIPPEWAYRGEISGNHVSFVADHETGLLRPVDPRGLTEYIEGGEYDERLKAIGGENVDLADDDPDPEYDELVVFPPYPSS